MMFHVVCINLINKTKHTLYFDSEADMNKGIDSLLECINGGEVYFNHFTRKNGGVVIPRTSIVSFEYSSKWVSAPERFQSKGR